MGQDPGVLQHWPDEPTAEKITKSYLAAIHPYLPAGARIAWQATVPALHGEASQQTKALERLRQWNAELRPEPWFDAVTVHLYPRLSEVIGEGAESEALSPEVARRHLHALLARMDDGLETAIQEVAARVPGKEIWVTEWNPAGAEAAGEEDGVETTTPPMLVHLAARSSLALLRQPQVTMALFYAIKFKPLDRKSLFVETRTGYEPTPWRSPSAG